MSTRCPVCDSQEVVPVLEIPQVPVFCNVLWRTEEEARQAPRGDLHLTFCPECGHLFNRAFDASRLAYEQTYENSLHFSPRFQGYVEELAARLVTRHNLEGRKIVEIGSGQGDFLRLLARLGNNRGVGFDPSYVPEISTKPTFGDVTFIQEYFSPRHPQAQASFYVARHVLEHLADPAAFLRDLRSGPGPGHEALIYLEVPNALYTLRDGGIWDLIYEHYSYFSAASLARLLRRSGYGVLEVQERFGGQFLGIEAQMGPDVPAEGSSGRPEPVGAAAVELRPLVDAFARTFKTKAAKWRAELEELGRKGQKALIWGVGSKGVTFLNLLPSTGVIKHVVDINPRKKGMFVAGSAQQICPPDELNALNPDVVIVMNPLYEQEIREILSEKGLSPRLVIA